MSTCWGKARAAALFHPLGTQYAVDVTRWALFVRAEHGMQCFLIAAQYRSCNACARASLRRLRCNRFKQQCVSGNLFYVTIQAAHGQKIVKWRSSKATETTLGASVIVFCRSGRWRDTLGSSRCHFGSMQEGSGEHFEKPSNARISSMSM